MKKPVPKRGSAAKVESKSPSAKTTAPPPTSARWQAFVLAALLALVTIALYWPAVHCDFVNYDDGDYVSQNEHVLAGLNLPNIKWAFTTYAASNWHPLTWLSLMLDASVFGAGPAGFHFTNVALHGLDAALLFLLAWQMTGAVWRSALVAALFAWHPVQVESVAWVSERKSVLSLAFGLLTLMAYVAYARGAMAKNQGELKGRQPSGGGKNASAPHSSFFILPASLAYYLSLFAFAGGLMSKQILVTWPCLMLLLDFWPLGRWRAPNAWALVKEKIPFFLLAAAASFLTVFSEKQGGSVVILGQLTFAERFGNALISYCRYIGKLFWPADLAVFYPHPGHWPLGWECAAALVLVAGSAAAFRLRRSQPFLFTGWFWYLGILAPVIGLVQVGAQAMADRHAYISATGIFILAAWGGVAVMSRWPGGRYLGTAMAAAAVLWCGGVTRRQLGYWQNSETLFRHALAVTRNNYVAHGNLGAALYDEGQTDEAIGQFKMALGIQPHYPVVHNSLGIAYFKQGRTNDAIQEFQEALHWQPNFLLARENLATVLLKSGQPEAAAAEFEKVLQAEPDNSAARNRLGAAHAKLGQSKLATEEFQEAIRLNPKLAEAHYNLGLARSRQGAYDQAISEFQAAIHWQPNYPEACADLGVALAQAGHIDRAITQLQEAIRLKPDFAEAHNYLGLALGQIGQLEPAIAQLQEALRCQPNFADAHNNLGLAFANQGRDDLAIKEFQEAIRLRPDLINARANLGAAYSRKGLLDEAIGQFQEILHLHPDNGEAKKSLTKLMDLKTRRNASSPAPAQQ